MNTSQSSRSELQTVLPEHLRAELEQQRRAHNAFAVSRRYAYVPRSTYLQRLDTHAIGGSAPLLITAPSGAGKSALIAYWEEAFSATYPDTPVVVHYAGAGTGSVDAISVVRRIILEIAERFRISTELPETPEAFIGAFSMWLGRVERPLVIALDGLNELPEKDRNLNWLPKYIPPTVRLLLSTTDAAMQETLRKRGMEEMALQPLEFMERQMIVEQFVSRRPSPGLFGAQAFASESSSANPLFLRTRLEEMRAATEHGNAHGVIDYYLGANTLDDLFERVLIRLEGEYGEETVRETMGLLWASRNGLQPDELQGMVKGPEGKLDSLLRALDYHVIRNDDVMTLFHDKFRESVRRKYLASDEERTRRHTTIATFFSEQRKRTERGIEEEPWQWNQAGNMHRLRECISSVPVFRMLVSEQKKYELIGYWLAAGTGHDVVQTYNKTLKEFERQHPNSSELAVMYSELGTFFNLCNRPHDAEKYCIRAVELYECYAGPDDPGIIPLLEALAGIYYVLHKQPKAVPLVQRMFRICETTQGPDAPDTIVAMTSIGIMYYGMSDDGRAESYLATAVKRAERALGEWHKVTADCLNNMGAQAESCMRNEEAIAHYRRAIAIYEVVLGPEYPEVASTSVNLGSLLRRIGRYEEAGELFTRAQTIYSRTVGPESALAAHTIALIGLLHRDYGENQQAEAAFRKTLEIFLAVYGEYHRETAGVLLLLARIVHRQGNADEAIALSIRTLQSAARCKHSHNIVSVETCAREILQELSYDIESIPIEISEDQILEH